MELVGLRTNTLELIRTGRETTGLASMAVSSMVGVRMKEATRCSWAISRELDNTGVARETIGVANESRLSKVGLDSICDEEGSR